MTKPNRSIKTATFYSNASAGSTVYLQNEEKLELSQKLAWHVDPRTTEFDDRRD